MAIKLNNKCGGIWTDSSKPPISCYTLNNNIRIGTWKPNGKGCHLTYTYRLERNKTHSDYYEHNYLYYTVSHDSSIEVVAFDETTNKVLVEFKGNVKPIWMSESILDDYYKADSSC